jgi:hypothetical protein
MSAPERDLKEWEFRALGRVLCRLPRHVVYLIILGLSIGFGLKSPDEARMVVEGAVQKLFLELHELRVVFEGLTRRIAPSGRRRQGPASLPTPREGGAGDFRDRALVSPPEIRQQIWRSSRIASHVCHVDAERLRGNYLRLRGAPCSTSAQRRTVAPAAGAIRLTGRHTYCWKHGIWWSWVEVLYQDEVLWAARYYLRCFG